MALGHPVIVVQCPGVAMRLGQVLPADQVVEQVIGVLDKLGVEQACVIGHSYGEITTTTKLGQGHA
jgi:pimeloyl-ACP methyl ester carboxylesterase